MTAAPAIPSVTWHQQAQALIPDGRQLVSGRRRAASEARLFDVDSPRNGAHLASAAWCGSEDIDHAVSVARECFNNGAWSKTHPQRRRETLAAWADAIRAHSDELALLISLEMGKPIKDCLAVDLPSVVRALRWYADITDKQSGAHPDVGPSSLALVDRVPAGVVGVVTPWNFPLAPIGYEVAPALALGNTVIVKPSELAPLSLLRCCELGIEAGIPAGALAVLPGPGDETGALLGLHPDVDAITVTGSSATGRAFLRYSADSNGKRVWPELGGKSAMLVNDDVPDIDAAARAIIWAAYFNQGQMCTGGQRILLHRQIHDDVLSAVLELIDGLVLGDPLDPRTDVGPLVTSAAATNVLEVIEEAAAAGGRLLRGGRRAEVTQGGSYLQPTLVAGAPPSVRLFTTEVFGPVASALPFNHLDEALSLAASPGYGMAISIWTASLETALAASRQAQVGTVWINSFEADDLTVPAGGVKRSGYGRTKSLAVLDKYSDLKTTWIQLLRGHS